MDGGLCVQLTELKQKLKDGALSQDLIIFKCNGQTFLAEQYLKIIAQSRDLEERIISSLADTKSSLSLVIDYTESINVIRTDIFNEFYDDYSDFDNTIIICNSIKEKKIEKNAKEYIIELPSLQKWQVLDYITTKCPGVAIDTAEWLYDAANGDINRIDNELSKIELFDTSEQNQILIDLKNSKRSDLYHLIDKTAKKPLADSFILKNWLLARDYKNIADFLIHENYINCADLNVFALVNLLMFDLKNRLLIKSSTAAEMNVSTGQYNFLKYNKLGYSLPTMLKKLNFLSSFDSKIKSGLLDLDSSVLLDCVICNFLGD